MTAPAGNAGMRAPSLETIGMSKSFGALRALQDVSIQVPAGSFHALLGENGAGKSTLVKCIMGFYAPDRGQLLLDGSEVAVRNPRDAQALGVGMVYQHFTLVPALTAAENLVVSRADAPSLIDWRKERRSLESFLDRMPFRVPLGKPVSGMAAGEKQKLEILKLLYLDQRFLILDEPTSVLTPGEADEILGLLRDMAHRGEITVAMISHKFREVEAFCDDFTVLRRGARVGGGKVGAVSTREMAAMMIGDAVVRPSAARAVSPKSGTTLEIAGLFAENDEGRDAVSGFDLKVAAGEIVGIAGVSGNGQSELVEALSGQRPIKLGQVLVHDQDFEPKRDHFDKFKIFGLPEEPLKNAAVPTMSVAENMAFRQFDKAPIVALGVLAVARADARQGARSHRPLQRENALDRNPNSRPFGRQRATRGAGARALRRRRRVDCRQPLLRPRLRVRRRHSGADHGTAQSRRGGVARVGGSRRNPRTFRPHRRHVRRQGRLSDASRRRRSNDDRPLYGGSLKASRSEARSPAGRRRSLRSNWRHEFRIL